MLWLPGQKAGPTFTYRFDTILGCNWNWVLSVEILRTQRMGEGLEAELQEDSSRRPLGRVALLSWSGGGMANGWVFPEGESSCYFSSHGP